MFYKDCDTAGPEAWRLALRVCAAPCISDPAPASRREGWRHRRFTQRKPWRGLCFTQLQKLQKLQVFTAIFEVFTTIFEISVYKKHVNF